jgi:beta-xylosidase
MSSAVPIPEEFNNPVHAEYLADPFCWYHDGYYYAVGTGKKEAGSSTSEPGNAVPLVRSRDLHIWESMGRVLVVPDEEAGNSCWAPEVAYNDGKFYMYYHPGNDTDGRRIRVAVSDLPEGPYIDTGIPLTDITKNRFAIDSHPFRDDDGQWYLFYATNFYDITDDTFRGTSLVVDRMVSMTEMAGDPQVVMRARWPWQCYERDKLAGGVVADWYTLEGPTLRKRDGKYYCFYSGGCYQNDSYGVDYLVADNIMGPWYEVGREQGPRIMRSVPDKVIGPGHHSIVTAPDTGQDYAVYHAWNAEMTARLMCVDKLMWTEDGPVIERFADICNGSGSVL